MSDRIAELERQIITLQREKQLAYERAEKAEKRVERLESTLEALTRKFFGISSEKIGTSNQLSLGVFDEPGSIVVEDESDSVTEVKAHTRAKKRQPRYLDPALPRQENIIDVREEDKQCGCGTEMRRIGEEVSEKLHVEPPKIIVIRTVRPYYACSGCEGSGDEDRPTFRIAPPAPSVIPGGLPTEGTLAYVITAKFCDAVPLYRQEQQFRRLGADVSRKTLSDWVLAAAAALTPVYEALKDHTRSGPVLLVDETRMQVMKEPERANTTQSWMWCSYGGAPEAPGIVFHYSTRRNLDTAKEVVGDYSNFLQTDGYSVYETLAESRPDLTMVGCMAHTRRKFFDAAKGTKKSGAAREALAYIAKLYGIDKRLSDRGRDEAFRQEREKLARPILAQFKHWLDEKEQTVLPSSTLGKAVSYALDQWPRLVRYLESPYLTPDTNRVENGIRPFAVGRRNWLFSGSPRGATASALLYSLIQTARANDVEPYRYLHTVLKRIPLITGEFDYSTLLPHQIQLE